MRFFFKLLDGLRAGCRSAHARMCVAEDETYINVFLTVSAAAGLITGPGHILRCSLKRVNDQETPAARSHVPLTVRGIRLPLH